MRPFNVLPGALSPDEIDAVIRHAEAADPDSMPGSAIPLLRTPEIDWLYDRLSRLTFGMNIHSYQFDLLPFSGPVRYEVQTVAGAGATDWRRDDVDSEGPPAKLSLVLPLSDPASYQGGDLQLLGGADPIAAPRERGALIVFPAYTLHRVAPVTTGVRRALTFTAGGPPLR